MPETAVKTVCEINMAVIAIETVYAGLLTGMCISLGSLISISGPLLAAAITPQGTQEEWRTVWIVMGCVFITGFTIFLSFGHASLQPWATGIDAQHHNIMSPFVTMGRRFSTFLEAPPLSPVSPVDKGFDFSLKHQSPSATGLAQMAITSPDIFYTGGFDYSKTIAESNLEPIEESQDSEDAGSTENDDESEYEDDTVEQMKQVRRRAVSESGLEVLKFNLEQESASEEQGTKFEWRNKAAEKVVGQTMVVTQSVHKEGVINYGYEDMEKPGNVHSEATFITRL